MTCFRSTRRREVAERTSRRHEVGAGIRARQSAGWKNEHWGFGDTAGVTRPNWTIYGTFSLGQKYDYDPDTKAFYFYAGGSTFRYDPAKRDVEGSRPRNEPAADAGRNSPLVVDVLRPWISKKFVLFGGGNVPTQRGDPGTWTYSPAENRWEQVKTNRQPPAARELAACLRPRRSQGGAVRGRPAE